MLTYLFVGYTIHNLREVRKFYEIIKFILEENYTHLYNLHGIYDYCNFSDMAFSLFKDLIVSVGLAFLPNNLLMQLS